MVCVVPAFNWWAHRMWKDVGDGFGTPNGAIATGAAAYITATSRAFEKMVPDLKVIKLVSLARDIEGGGLGALLNGANLPSTVGAIAGVGAGIVAAAVLPEVGLLAGVAAGTLAIVAAGALATAEAQSAIEAINAARNGYIGPNGEDLTPDGADGGTTPPTGPSDIGADPGCPGPDRSKRRSPLPPGTPNYSDPLVLDLTGAGINLTSLNGSNAYFDFTNSGYRQKTGWIGSGEGILVINPADGETVTASNVLGAQSGSGFQDLAALDVNGDGVVDESDPGYSDLRVWFDVNFDGTSSSGELFSLADLGIESIAVASNTDGSIVNGNVITATSTFTLSGSTQQFEIAEVNFATSRQETIVPSEINTGYSVQALTLPNLDGYGAMPDLRVAMSLSSQLAAEAQNLVDNSASMTGEQFDAAFQTLVLDWAGVSNIDPTSKGLYADARHIDLIYAVYGIDPSSDPYYQQDPNWHNGPSVWEPLYQDIISELKTRFVSQIASSVAANASDISDVFDNPYTAFYNLGFDETQDQFTGDIQLVFDGVTANSLTAADPALYWSQVLPILEGLKGEQVNQTSLGAVDLLEYAINAQFPTEEVTALGNEIGVSVSDQNGLISFSRGNLVTTAFLAGSNDSTITANFQTILLPDYDPANTAIYRASGTDNLIIENIDSGSALTVTAFFSSGIFWPATIEMGDGSRYSASNIGELIASAATADLGVALDQQAKENALDLLHYDIETDPAAITSGNGSVAFEVTGDAAMSVPCDRNGDGGNIVFFLNGSRPQDIVVNQSGLNGDDLTLTNTASGQTITLSGQGDQQSAHIQEVVFEDGTAWTADYLWAASEATATAQDAPLIVAAYGDNNLTAGNGPVEMRSSADDTVYTTGAGADIITMTGHGNTYNVSSATNSLQIQRQSETYYGFPPANILKLPDGVSPSDVTVSQGGGDSIILSTATGLTITIDDALSDAGSSSNDVDLVKFSDGSSWTISDLVTRSIATMEAQGNDTVICVNTGGNLSFTAGAGNVTLDGFSIQGNNPDIPVVFTAGSGNDTIIGNSQGSTTYVIPVDAENVEIQKEQDYGAENMLEFGAGVSPDQIAIFQGTNGTYIFENLATGSQITLHGSIVGDGGSWNKISTVTFADGTIWSASDILDQVHTIDGSSGDDVLQAPDGNATVIGEGGNDTLLAGVGSDILIGGGGITNFAVGGLPGSLDILEARSDGWFQPMTVGQLSLTDIASSDVTATLDQNGSDVDLTVVGTNQRIKLIGEISDAPVVNGIQFADGVTWMLADIEQKVGITPDASLIEGTIGDDILQAGPGDVTVIGEGGNDTLIAGDGNDILIGGGGYLTYVVPVTSSNVTIEAQGGDPNGPGGPSGPVGLMMVAETASANSTASSSAPYGPDGELDLQGVTSTSIQLSLGSNGSDVILTNIDTGGTVTIQDELSNSTVDAVVFDDGTTWFESDLESMLNSGGSGGDGGTVLPPGNYTGTDGDDSFNLGDGFSVDGGLGDDHFSVSGDGAGTFIFAKGNGHDELDQPDGATRNDTLSLTDINSDELSVTRDADPNSDALTFTVDTTGDSFRADWQFYGDQPDSAPQGIEEVEFADGVVWDRNEIRNRSSDAVTAVAATDLSATADSDIFDVSGLSGDRSITGFDTTSESHDYVQVNRSVFEDWAHLLGATQQIGSDLTIALDQNDSITLKDVALANFSSKDVKFVGSMASAGIG
jgi:Ca2+-binding RTX toxin-like protein